VIIVSSAFMPLLHPANLKATQVLLSPDFTDRPPVLLPVQPAPRILAHILPPRMLRQLRRRATPNSGFAVDYDFGVFARSLEAEAVLELLVRHVEAVWDRRDGDVDCARNGAAGFELVFLADV
jgi:hypothetical protein